MKIYDAFLFFNELDLLELRLELLYNYVDYFIISECDYTFSGLPKPFYFEENKDIFSRFKDKIIHIKHHNSNEIDSFVNPYGDLEQKNFDRYNTIINYYDTTIKYSSQTDYGKPWWCRDMLHREYVSFGMHKCLDDDIIIFGDLDEIPDPLKIRTDGNSYVCHQKNMIYYLNKENITETWHGTVIVPYAKIKNNPLEIIRSSRFKMNIIKDAGWHCSWMGGSDRIKTKIISWSHQEYNRSDIIKGIETKLDTNKDVLNHQITINQIDMLRYYPKEFVDMAKNKFPYLIS